MATNLTNASVFTATAMKPAIDEVITADWGQKLAENTMYNYANPINSPSISIHAAADSAWLASISDTGGTVWFQRPAYCGTLRGTVSFRRYSSNAVTQHCTVRVDGTNITPANSGTLSSSGNSTTTFGFAFPCAHLGTATDYTFVLNIQDTSGATILQANANCNTRFTP